MIIEDIFGKQKWTDTEKIIINFIEVNPKVSINLSLEEISDQCYVSQASIIRFCKKAGTKGYSDFRIILASQLSSFALSEKQIHVDVPINKNDTTEDIADTFYNLTHQALEKAYNNINEEDLNQAADLLHQADLIHIYGRGESLIIAEDFHYKLLRIGKRSVLDTPNGFQEAGSIKQSSRINEAALVISQYCNSRQVNYVVDELMANNIPYILLTAAEKAWPYDYFSKVSLKVKDNESRYKMGSFSSRTSMLYTLDCLYGKLFSLDYDLNKKISLSFLKEKQNEIIFMIRIKIVRISLLRGLVYVQIPRHYL